MPVVSYGCETWSTVLREKQAGGGGFIFKPNTLKTAGIHKKSERLFYVQLRMLSTGDKCSLEMMQHFIHFNIET